MTALVVVGLVGVLSVVGYVATLGADESGEMTGVRRGTASGFDITTSMSRLAMWVSTVHTRPRTRCWPWLVRGKGTPARDLGIDLGYAPWWGKGRRRVMASFESVTLVVGPPGVGKSGLLGRIIRDAPGPVVAASTAIDLYKNTHEVRESVGPVTVFNPENDGEVPNTLCWPIVPGCEDPQTAILRAGSLIGGANLDNLKDGAFWKGHAHRTLYSLLMAAALQGLRMDAVQEWAANLRDRRPYDILVDHADRAPKGWAGTLARWHDLQSSKMLDSVVSVLQPTLEFLNEPGLRACVMPKRDQQVFDAAGMIRRSGSLFIVATQRENSPVGPLSAALVSYLHETAKKLGAAERLDPPLGEVIDEPYLTCPVPLDQWSSDSRKYGIFEVFGFQNRSQLREMLGQEKAMTVQANSTVKVGFNSITDETLLKDLSELGGHKVVRVGDRFEESPVLRPADIRNLPDGQAVLIYKNKRPLVFTPQAVWQRPRQTARTKPQPAPSAPAPRSRVVDLSDARARREAS